MVAAPGAVLNETGLIGIRITSADHEAGGGQPMVGIVDCGASFTTVNWAGASLLNLPGRSEIGAYKETPPVYAVGVDGRPLPLLRHKARLSFAGDPYRDDQGTQQAPARLPACAASCTCAPVPRAGQCR